MSESADLQRIRGDLAKARQRIAAIHAGTMGARPTAESGELGQAGAPVAWEAAATTKLPLPNGALAWQNQLRAREADVLRLEAELLQALIARGGKYSPSEILRRVEAPPVTAPAPEIRTVVETVVSDATRNLLRALLDGCSDRFILRSKLEELFNV